MRGRWACVGVLGVLIWRLIASDKRYIDLASEGRLHRLLTAGTDRAAQPALSYTLHFLVAVQGWQHTEFLFGMSTHDMFLLYIKITWNEFYLV